VNLEVNSSPIGDGNALLIAVDGELELASCDRLKPAADEAVFGSRPLVLDLSHCSFIDSTGLRLVLQIYKALSDEATLAVPMAVVVGRSEIRRLFSLTAIDQSIPLFQTRQEALDWLDSKLKPGGESASLSPPSRGTPA